MTKTTSAVTTFSSYLTSLPLVAILRGIQNHECMAIADALYQAGFRCIEVPLGSPNAFRSIEMLAASLPGDCLVGAGTVLGSGQVQSVADAGGRLIVMPHNDAAVIAAAKQTDMFCVPGVATISEAFAALAQGADALKLFPSESVPPSVLKAWRTVLPDGAICLPVGGVAPQGMQEYFLAGANGFGLGAGLYKPGMTARQVAEKATAFVAALEER
ncbi:2-dehydro-3-deoxy-6-phosphogalactonate aldolase [Undibacterium sp.]|jgi:2-dehydro-3-deoxyphosphogalactonate aldolase|uniref:2-dehydro-3-deoxy-6-phosphogalactonate aldolase n=1 Tax=Undibacterium sp. TaxID=1914977 RepID=UPI002D19D2E4|nr:2-dehydro-3-deoxy-6-phosphogalactonate aldolase [Undibacterium sp.]HTD02654.1 2-dehydro-3-deoxy-6-phosphogalactonate aldolase [Undibacterium sp.]